MKLKNNPAIFQAVLLLAPFLLLSQYAKAEIVKVDDNLESDPLIIIGKSGGSVNSNRGVIPKTPHQVLKLKKPLSYLQITVESESKPTLLIDSPVGKFCILYDAYSGNKPKISGFFKDGTYKLYIGQMVPGKSPKYTLSISQHEK